MIKLIGLLMILGVSIVYLLIIYASYRYNKSRGLHQSSRYRPEYNHTGNSLLWDKYIRHTSHKIEQTLKNDADSTVHWTDGSKAWRNIDHGARITRY
jgi:hypothetical protein